MPAIVDLEECISCGACETVCPVDAVTVEDMVNVDSSKCVECGNCETECPVGPV
ncbi:Ferredoxin [Methanonatronarchaeum thermophilum]|uniref:Ferredoxin n=1 Tax=Methanonatronarchaeum thermophilum TaxID=1927129 RepID=A0A1Y3GC53_9EURY|nr:4Fe-4S binding protein [Methanonatronarchaeum thermophilum]OUJ19008.1 Ferredoxin [Methanonatronarchaeum thermophilum]